MFINRYIALAATAIALIASGCDNIDSDDRYQTMAKPELPGVPRTLLIQEFTGHNCRNCPAGAAAIKAIADAYPGRVITVGMHPEGGGSNTAPLGVQDFRCNEAQVMYLHYKPSGFPCAVFGGIETSAQTVDWMTVAIPFMSLEAPLDISANCSFNADTRNLTVNYSVEMRQSVKTQLSIMVWVVENGIVGIQNDKGNYVMDYVHNHVLRTSLNGDWGTPLALNTDGSPLAQYSPLATFSGNASGALDTKWVADNCNIVLWVFNTATKEVMQAIETQVIPSVQ